MKRREFITLVGGAAATWPMAAHAQQQPLRTRIVGTFYGYADIPETLAELAAFKESLGQLGWSEGRNIRFETRFFVPDAGRRREIARELVALKADVILTWATPTTAAVFAETRTIPIVFVNASDPVGSGFAVSLAHPDGNVTGFTNFVDTISQKWLELLKEIAPNVRRVRVIFNPDTTPGGGQFFFRPIEVTARALQIEAIASPVRNASDIAEATNALANATDVGLVMLPDTFMSQYQALIISEALKNRIPSVFGNMSYVRAGGLLSYDIDRIEQARRAASYVDRILKGEKSGDLPIQAPAKFKLTINLKTAKALGLDVPWILEQRADEVIE